MRADQAASYTAADKKHGRGGAMIGAAAAVFAGAAAELGKRHDQNAVAMPPRCQVAVKCADRIGQFAKQIRVCSRLTRVRVEAVDGNIEESSAQTGVDKLCRQAKMVG